MPLSTAAISRIYLSERERETNRVGLDCFNLLYFYIYNSSAKVAVYVNDMEIYLNHHRTSLTKRHKGYSRNASC